MHKLEVFRSDGRVRSLSGREGKQGIEWLAEKLVKQYVTPGTFSITSAFVWAAPCRASAPRAEL